MSGIGNPAYEVLPGKGKRIAVIAASWHPEIIDNLVYGAEQYLANCGATFHTYRVPGSFELPLAAKSLLQGDFDGAVVLGLVLRGETPHFDFVSSGVTHGLVQIMIEMEKPIGFGLLTCDTLDQAIARSEKSSGGSNKGIEAAHAAVSMIQLKRMLAES